MHGRCVLLPLVPVMMLLVESPAFEGTAIVLLNVLVPPPFLAPS